MQSEGDPSDRLAFLGRLAGGLAHEIKNPLSTMMVTLQLLEEDWADAADSHEPRELRTLRKIQLLLREVNRLEGILNEFLRFARGPQKQLEPVDLDALVGEVLDFIEPEATKYGIRIRFQGSGGLPPCRLDRNLFKQALFNVFVNAQQAMEESGGELMVRTARNSAPHVDLVTLRIVDTGPGIPEEVLARVFDVYFSTKRTGTGLGLPTARRFIEEHGGRIDITSEVGRGTIVTIELPLDTAAETTKEPS